MTRRLILRILQYLCVVTLGVITVVLIVSPQMLLLSTELDVDEFPRISRPVGDAACVPRAPDQPCFVLFWTDYFEWDPVSAYMSNGRGRPEDCSDACVFTKNHTLLPNASVVVFHCMNFDRNDLPVYYCGQKWMFWCLESPPKYHAKFAPGDYDLFDITSTYRLDSDVPIPYAGYGEKHKRTLTRLPPQPFETKNLNVPVAWVASNCMATSPRKEYVEELMTHIDVASYGGCLNNRPKRLHNGYSADVLGTILGGHKFYLSFENSECDYYVTEKLARTYELGLVPVVMGPADITPFEVQHGALLNVADYSSPRALAEYLTFLSNNETAYNAYLAYKLNNGSAISEQYKRYWLAPRPPACCEVASIAIRGTLLTGSSPRGNALDTSCKP